MGRNLKPKTLESKPKTLSPKTLNPKPQNVAILLLPTVSNLFEPQFALRRPRELRKGSLTICIYVNHSLLCIKGTVGSNNIATFWGLGFRFLGFRD